MALHLEIIPAVERIVAAEIADLQMIWFAHQTISEREEERKPFVLNNEQIKNVHLLFASFVRAIQLLLPYFWLATAAILFMLSQS